ncbi:DMT family transporter [Bacillus methanolicus]|uniref:Small multidrug resistance protein n=1 Tax=Bacillus methanolicus (strain MGA3 / ATCC 53907) TaxID=796606 RepID=I3EB76_BACMM|nr:multidrug efflux SMR transporter [Bacillus methanolicus]AIE61429.1 small multidrug resistance protein [Bacillus methanolicus MGA3]EIJ83747.1 multidrug resistance protein, SMR family [Bacillus methanolicus MGA3]
MSWVFLILGIISEVLGTTSMKMSEGFTKLIPSILIFVFYGLSLTLVTLALKNIDVSIVYSIWSGLGTAIIATIGILYFKEYISLIKVLSILMIIAGVIGLNISGETQGKETSSSQLQIERDGN